MAKYIVDEADIPDPKTLEKIARFFDRIDDPYRMPELMAEMYQQNREKSGEVDTYYAVTIGYGYDAMQLRCTFKRSMLVMEFTAPDGMRLMELRLHV